jgi:23S rRNA U2552 (ribose-2'-O)-methylase RlmE/FtsJ
MDSKPVPPWVTATQAWQKTPANPLEPLPQLTFGPWPAAPAAAQALQTAKEAITPLEQTRRWELIKKMVNPYEMVFTHEDKYFHKSLSILKPLSRSYFKMIEILDVLQFFERLPKQFPKLRSSHVAEGPGGFIQAFLDLAERAKRRVDAVTAMTLKPTDQNVPGWRRATNFLRHHREIKLHYGANGTGNIYHAENQESFVKLVAPGTQLFTADGGFDFSVDYSIQEKAVFHLLVSSSIIGLQSLQKDGCFVIKIFDIFAAPTQTLLSLVGRCFKEWMLYKPAVSRPCNSERYFLGRGFKGCPQPLLSILRQMESHAVTDLFPKELPGAQDVAYLEAHIQQNTEEQLRALRRAQGFAVNPMTWYTNQLPLDFQTSLTWCSRFHIPTLLRTPLPLEPPTDLLSLYTSSQVALRQLPSPGAGSDCPAPSGLASQALSEGSQNRILQAGSPSQTDVGSHAQTLEGAP